MSISRPPDRHKGFPLRGHLRVALLAFGFLAIGSWWGMPHATSPERVQSWGVDDESPLGPLAEIHNIIEPKDDPWLSYPLMYSFTASAAYAPYLAYLFATGGLTGVSGTFPFGLQDPVRSLKVLTLLAHLVSVLMGTLVVVAAYDIGRTLSNARTGTLYGLFVLGSFPLVYYARNGNVDATAMAFLALSVAAFTRIGRDGWTLRRAIALGFSAGFALATKESSVGILLGMPPVLLLLQFGPGRSDAWPSTPRIFWKHVVAAFTLSVLAFGIGSGLFVDPDRYLAHVAYLRGLLETVSADATAVAFTFPYDFAGHLGYLGATVRNLVEAVSLPGVGLILIGIVAAVREKTSLRWVPAALALFYLSYLFLSYRLVQVRYLMPVTVFLSFYLADTVAAASTTPRRWGSRLVLAAGVLAGGYVALNAVDLTYQMLRDSRYAAGDWLRNQTAPGSVVSYFGPVGKLPHLEAGVVTHLATEYGGMYVEPLLDEAKVREILAGWDERRPDFVIVMPDHTNPQPTPYSHTVPPELFAGLVEGRLGYRQTAYFETPPLFPWLKLPLLDYAVVNPPIRIFQRESPP